MYDLSSIRFNNGTRYEFDDDVIVDKIVQFIVKIMRYIYTHSIYPYVVGSITVYPIVHP